MRRSSFFCFLFFSTIAQCAPENYYGNRREGWYSYEKDHIPEKPKKKIEHKFIITPENLSKLNAKQFKELFESVKEEAFLHPESSSVRSYIIMQNYSISQADKFKDQYRAETLKDGSLDISNGFQTSAFAHGVKLKEDEDKRKKFFIDNKDKAGFVVFFDSRESIEKIKAQQTVLTNMESDYGIKSIFVDLSTNPQLRAQNKITATPDTWLMIKQNDGSTFKSRVSSGVSDRKAILEGIEFVVDFYLKNQGREN